MATYVWVGSSQRRLTNIIWDRANKTMTGSLTEIKDFNGVLNQLAQMREGQTCKIMDDNNQLKTRHYYSATIGDIKILSNTINDPLTYRIRFNKCTLSPSDDYTLDKGVLEKDPYQKIPLRRTSNRGLLHDIGTEFPLINQRLASPMATLKKNLVPQPSDKSFLTQLIEQDNSSEHPSLADEQSSQADRQVKSPTAGMYPCEIVWYKKDQATLKKKKADEKEYAKQAEGARNFYLANNRGVGKGLAIGSPGPRQQGEERATSPGPMEMKKLLAAPLRKMVSPRSQGFGQRRLGPMQKSPEDGLRETISPDQAERRQRLFSPRLISSLIKKQQEGKFPVIDPGPKGQFKEKKKRTTPDENS